ncbi:hypothetical protein Ddye_014416 [Dipteronia dyeriana]|uniref:Malectin-like domain-containing protein n=1 Tax=Dipteronia dyeriana TaxID=168575 RepID=A0AAD9X885_9ROSI|nr:hypothetical protein Ddye_014416 [Dipteronia dyeriana]
MVDRQPSFLVLQLLWLVLVSVIISTVSNSKLAEAYEANVSGFINIDCGASESYTDKQNGLIYESDTKYIDTGEIHAISPDFINMTSHQQQRYNLRSFPQGKRNCYTLKPNQGGNNNYLIRAVFEYGNYDDNDKIPVFDLYLGVNNWTTVRDAISVYEIIHFSLAEYIDVCLVNIGGGVPYISALELRPLNNSIYRIQNGALSLHGRYDVGGSASVNRYREDVYDRLWYPLDSIIDWNLMNSTIHTQISDNNGYKVPDQVLRTAATVDGTSPSSLNFNPSPNDGSLSNPLNFAGLPPPSPQLSFYLDTSSDDAFHQFCVYFHFAELLDSTDGQMRELRIYINGGRHLIEPVILDGYLKPVTINTTFQQIKSQIISVTIYGADDSYLPPILNAVEIYEIIELQHPPTNLDDVHAIRKIKSVYGVERNWQGDPCLPLGHQWDGVICSIDGSNAKNPPRIISLNLSWSGLTGEIDPSFASLTAIQYLNLNGNKLTGLVPADLFEKSKNGSLSLSVEGNPDICLSATLCKKKKTELLVPVIASIAAFSVGLIATLAIFWRLKIRKKQATVVLGKSESKSQYKDDTLAAKKQRFTYSDIAKITKNFKMFLGKGGFGTVYHGYLDDTEVAVNYKKFHN